VLPTVVELRRSPFRTSPTLADWVCWEHLLILQTTWSGVGSVGDSPVHGRNGVVDAVDRGVCGWSGIVGADGGQPAKGVS
jgi:hypothetical protein